NDSASILEGTSLAAMETSPADKVCMSSLGVVVPSSESLPATLQPTKLMETEAVEPNTRTSLLNSQLMKETAFALSSFKARSLEKWQSMKATVSLNLAATISNDENRLPRISTCSFAI